MSALSLSLSFPNLLFLGPFFLHPYSLSVTDLTRVIGARIIASYFLDFIDWFVWKIVSWLSLMQTQVVESVALFVQWLECHLPLFSLSPFLSPSRVAAPTESVGKENSEEFFDFRGRKTRNGRRTTNLRKEGRWGRECEEGSVSPNGCLIRWTQQSDYSMGDEDKRGIRGEWHRYSIGGWVSLLLLDILRRETEVCFLPRTKEDKKITSWSEAENRTKRETRRLR